VKDRTKVNFFSWTMGWERRRAARPSACMIPCKKGLKRHHKEPFHLRGGRLIPPFVKCTRPRLPPIHVVERFNAQTFLYFLKPFFWSSADRADPGTRYLLERRTRSNSPIRISDSRIIDPTAYGAPPLVHGLSLCALSVNSVGEQFWKWFFLVIAANHNLYLLMPCFRRSFVAGRRAMKRKPGDGWDSPTRQEKEGGKR